MRAKDADWLDEQRDIFLQSGKLGEFSSVYIGRVIVKLEEIGQEFAALQAENELLKNKLVKPTPGLSKHNNGITCPDCGTEMYDTNPEKILLSNPPQLNTGCKCGYRGFRFL